jgi:hypothetical protein
MTSALQAASIIAEKQEACDHRTYFNKWKSESAVRWTTMNRFVCARCAKTATDIRMLIPHPKYFLMRNTQDKDSKGHCNWGHCPWARAGSWLDAEKCILAWNSASIQSGDNWEYKLPLHCEKCYDICHETYPALGLANMVGKHVCLKCHQEGKGILQQEQAKMKYCLKCGCQVDKHFMGSLLCIDCYHLKSQNVAVTSKAKVRTVGEIWKLDSANAPMNVNQWGYQGSSKAPYIVSNYATKRDGSTTTDGWACSCMSFTRNVPRTPCKHILNVMLQEGKKPSTLKSKHEDLAALAGLGDADVDAFKKWQKEQAAAKEIKPTSGSELNLFGATGRRFR